MLVKTDALYDSYYGVFLSYNATKRRVSYLTLDPVTRETRVATEYLSTAHMFMKKYVPDVPFNDMTQLLQLLADGKLRDTPPPTTVHLERSVKGIMKRSARSHPEVVSD